MRGEQIERAQGSPQLQQQLKPQPPVVTQQAQPAQTSTARATATGSTTEKVKGFIAHAKEELEETLHRMPVGGIDTASGEAVGDSSAAVVNGPVGPTGPAYTTQAAPARVSTTPARAPMAPAPAPAAPAKSMTMYPTPFGGAAELEELSERSTPVEHAPITDEAWTELQSIARDAKRHSEYLENELAAITKRTAGSGRAVSVNELYRELRDAIEDAKGHADYLSEKLHHFGHATKLAAADKMHLRHTAPSTADVMPATEQHSHLHMHSQAQRAEQGTSLTTPAASPTDERSSYQGSFGPSGGRMQ